MGIFHRFEYFDIMIVLDFMTFLSTLFFLLIYLLTALCPTPNVKFLLMLDSDETMTRDFLDSEHLLRYTVVQLFSYFILSIGVVLICRNDVKQVPLDIQYYNMGFEIFIMFSLYFGAQWMKWFSVLSYVLRIAVIIGWGW